MSELGDALRKNLADTFALYLKTHFYHWNVEGADFYEYHKFFNKLYDELWLAVDSIAEHIRTLNEYAPGSLSRFKELTTIQDELAIPSGLGMVEKLLSDNSIVIDNLNITQKMATQAGQDGIANFLQERIDIHNKHGWMLRSTLKNR